ncbi:MAG: hypothetical protein ACKV2Q_30890 [Planctomycetaceae bacterium]
MFLRQTRWVASVLALGISAATVVAQPPAGSANGPPLANSLIAPPSAYPQEAGDFQFNHWDDDGGSLFGDLELSPQFRFQADWIYYTRQNRARALPIISGDESFTTRNADFNFNSGYRLTLAFMHDDYEFEGSYFELNGLGASHSGSLTNALVFDGESAFLNSSGAARATFGAVPNFLESSTFFAPINTAANFNSLTPANNEDNELEFLDPGAQFDVRYDTELQDFDFNLKGRRQTGRLLRFGFGYRNIQLSEGGFAALRGTFNTLDNDGVDLAGSNAENNALGNTSLTTGAGLTLASGVGGFFEATPPDQLLFSTTTRATNQLNGVQATVDATFLESEHFQIGGYAKAGVYHNRARGSVAEVYQELVNNQSRYTRSFSDSKDRAAFAGNLGLTGTIFLRDNLRLTGGYEMMLLSGVALAPDQAGGLRTDIGNVTSLALQTHGNALFHGGRVGIEILFP